MKANKDPMNSEAEQPSLESPSVDSPSDATNVESRRTFFSTCGNLAMAGGLAASYGTLGYCAIKFLKPDDKDPNLDWQFVATLDSLGDVTSFEFTASSGVKVVIARAVEISETGFLALSSVCPHLGCQVYWEAVKNRFFCPCHNGTFDATGKATGGPPADANQSLTQYPTKLNNNSLYVYAPLETVTQTRRSS